MKSTKKVTLATQRLQDLLKQITIEIESLSSLGVGEFDEHDEDGCITFLYQDVSLLKFFRQHSEQPQSPALEEGLQVQDGQKTTSHTQHSREWKIQIGNTQQGNIYQCCISRLSGVIEETTGREFRTSDSQMDTQSKQS